MNNTDSQPRVLLLSAGGDLANLFADAALSGWECVPAKNSGQAAVLCQSKPCDIVVADESHYHKEGLEGIHWLTYQVRCPIVLVADVNARIVARAYGRGVSAWLPAKYVRAQPRLLHHTLERLLHCRRLQLRCEQSEQALEQCQHEVDRLVSLFRRAGKLDAEKHWYSQRHMLQRLAEEIARAGRHGTPLTVALGEAQLATPETADTDNSDLIDWTAGQIFQQKRRSDVAGQYGLRTFMLLMPHTTTRGGVSCCRRLQHQLEDIPSGPVPHRSLRAYFGLVSLSPQCETAQRLLRSAEEHLDRAKQNASNRIIADEAN